MRIQLSGQKQALDVPAEALRRNVRSGIDDLLGEALSKGVIEMLRDRLGVEKSAAGGSNPVMDYASRVAAGRRLGQTIPSLSPGALHNLGYGGGTYQMAMDAASGDYTTPGSATATYPWNSITSPSAVAGPIDAWRPAASGVARKTQTHEGRHVIDALRGMTPTEGRAGWSAGRWNNAGQRVNSVLNRAGEWAYQKGRHRLQPPNSTSRSLPRGALRLNAAVQRKMNALGNVEHKVRRGLSKVKNVARNTGRNLAYKGRIASTYPEYLARVYGPRARNIVSQGGRGARQVVRRVQDTGGEAAAAVPPAAHAVASKAGPAAAALTRYLAGGVGGGAAVPASLAAGLLAAPYIEHKGTGPAYGGASPFLYSAPSVNEIKRRQQQGRYGRQQLEG